MIRKIGLLALALSASLATAADRPRALAGVAGGEWSLSQFADGRRATRVCLADPVQLAVWEHRGGHCRSVVLSDRGNRVVVDYRCDDGGFGRSVVEVLTPRSLRIATQGISAQYPFNYVVHARYVGPCRARRR